MSRTDNSSFKGSDSAELMKLSIRRFDGEAKHYGKEIGTQLLMNVQKRKHLTEKLAT
jgi:hypothetical protein